MDLGQKKNFHDTIFSGALSKGTFQYETPCITYVIPKKRLLLLEGTSSIRPQFVTFLDNIPLRYYKQNMPPKREIMHFDEDCSVLERKYGRDRYG